MIPVTKHLQNIPFTQKYYPSLILFIQNPLNATQTLGGYSQKDKRCKDMIM